LELPRDTLFELAVVENLRFVVGMMMSFSPTHEVCVNRSTLRGLNTHVIREESAKSDPILSAPARRSLVIRTLCTADTGMYLLSPVSRDLQRGEV